MNEKETIKNKEKLTELDLQYMLEAVTENGDELPFDMFELIMPQVEQFLPESLHKAFSSYIKYHQLYSNKEKERIYQKGYEDALEEKAQSIYRAGYETGVIDKTMKCRARKRRINKRRTKNIISVR